MSCHHCEREVRKGTEQTPVRIETGNVVLLGCRAHVGMALYRLRVGGAIDVDGVREARAAAFAIAGAGERMIQKKLDSILEQLDRILTAATLDRGGSL